VSITEEAIQLQNEVPTQIGRLPHMPKVVRSLRRIRMPVSA
jgi:hypothetical protein